MFQKNVSHPINVLSVIRVWLGFYKYPQRDINQCRFGRKYNGCNSFWGKNASVFYADMSREIAFELTKGLSPGYLKVIL